VLVIVLFVVLQKQVTAGYISGARQGLANLPFTVFPPLAQT
jgi:hypothetical protein